MSRSKIFFHIYLILFGVLGMIATGWSFIRAEWQATRVTTGVPAQFIAVVVFVLFLTVVVRAIKEIVALRSIKKNDIQD